MFAGRAGRISEPWQWYRHFDRLEKPPPPACCRPNDHFLAFPLPDRRTERFVQEHRSLERFERSGLIKDVEEELRVANRRAHLQPVAHDPGIIEQDLDPALAEACNLARVEGVEGLPVALALAKDRDPAQARLGPLKDQELEE